MQLTTDNTILPPITVVIATRNRPGIVGLAVQSVLKNDYPDFSLILVDQSDNEYTRNATLHFFSDKRFSYIHSHTKGLGFSHNLAISKAHSEIIAITDDDCEVPISWLRQLVEPFKKNEQLGMVFGDVKPASYDVESGYIPEYLRDTPYLIQDIKSDLFRGLGIGACMALRKKAWKAVHGFDLMLGPGSPLGSLEDRDMAIRLLLAGYYVYYTPEIQVIHYGFRHNTELRALAFSDWFGFGSSYAKYLKSGHWETTYYLVGQMFFGQAVKRFLHGLVKEHRLTRITPIITFWLGFIAGLLTKVDSHTNHFVLTKRSRIINHEGFSRVWLGIAKRFFPKHGEAKRVESDYVETPID